MLLLRNNLPTDYKHRLQIFWITELIRVIPRWTPRVFGRRCKVLDEKLDTTGSLPVSTPSQPPSVPQTGNIAQLINWRGKWNDITLNEIKGVHARQHLYLQRATTAQIYRSLYNTTIFAILLFLLSSEQVIILEPTLRNCWPRSNKMKSKNILQDSVLVLLSSLSKDTVELPRRRQRTLVTNVNRPGFHWLRDVSRMHLLFLVIKHVGDKVSRIHKSNIRVPHIKFL